MYPEFSEVTSQAIQKERNPQRILTNVAMTYLKNSGSLNSQAAAETHTLFMTALGDSQMGATFTRAVIKSKRRARGKQVLASGLPNAGKEATPQAHPRDGNDRYKCQKNKEQETDKL